MAKRTRSNLVGIRMNEQEYEEFQEKLEASGLSKQAYGICALLSGSITSAEEINILKEISQTFADIADQLWELTSKVNQMTHIAHSQCNLPAENELKRLSVQISNYRKDSEQIWQLIRSSITQPTTTAQ